MKISEVILLMAGCIMLGVGIPDNSSILIGLGFWLVASTIVGAIKNQGGQK